MDESLVAREEAMPARQKISLQPSLALMLAEHLHNAAVRRKMIVPRQRFGNPGTIGDFQRILPTVRVVLVRTEAPEISSVHVQLHHIAQEPAHNAGGFFRDCTRSWHRDRVIAEVRES